VLAPAPSNHEDSHTYGFNTLKILVLADPAQRDWESGPQGL